MQQLKQNQQHVLWPPAKIPTPRFGSDVAARRSRAALRAAVLQVPKEYDAATAPTALHANMTAATAAAAHASRDCRRIGVGLDIEE